MILKSFIATCQMQVVDDKEANLKKVVEMVEQATSKGAHLVVLLEMFNCPYDTVKFSEYAESRDSSQTLKTVSKQPESVVCTWLQAPSPSATRIVSLTPASF